MTISQEKKKNPCILNGRTGYEEKRELFLVFSYPWLLNLSDNIYQPMLVSNHFAH